MRHSPPWSIFCHLGRENFAAVPKHRVLLSTIAAESPRRNKTIMQMRGGPNLFFIFFSNGRETKLWAGNETPDRTGSTSGDHESPVKAVPEKKYKQGLPRADSALATRGLHGAGGMTACIRREPAHAKVERATHCSSSRGVSPTRNESKRCGERRTEIRSEHSRGQYGIEIVRGEGRCGRLRFGMTRRVARTRPERGR